MKTIRVSQLKDPERYQALYEALMSGTEIEGCVVTCYSEYHEGCELISEFTLQPPEPEQDDQE